MFPIINVAERLKSLRTKLDISTPRIAELTGIPQSVISKLENGKRKADVETLEKVLGVLGVTLSEFFTDGFDEMSPDIHQILISVKRMNSEQQKALKQFLDTMIPLKGGEKM